ncbi:MAG: hypothetical protein R3181_14815, partial [Rubricoccaceae bacterium]|nr:hypothetical protein [Rubricoccaceae bacterium]
MRIASLSLLALLLTGAASAQAPSPSGVDVCADDVLLVPDTSLDGVAVFDAQTGDLLDGAFIVDPVRLPAPVAALPTFDDDGVLVVDQNEDAVYEYDCQGNFVGLFAPAGGVDTSILEFPGGMSYSPDGTELWVTVRIGANRGAIAAFDASGNYVGNFAELGSDTTPIDVRVREATTDVLVSENRYDDVYRYDYSGTLLEVLVDSDGTTGLNNPQQVAPAAGGTLLVAGFSSPSGVYEYDGAGSQIGYYDVVTNARGVYELSNGNLLIARSPSLVEVARDNTLVRIVASVGDRYIHRFPATGGGSVDVCAEDVLLVPTLTGPGVAVFDARTGDPLDEGFIVDPANLQFPLEVIPNFDDDGVFVVDQGRDAVYEYDCTGNFVGLFAPAGGVDTSILDRPEGLSLDPTGTRLLVTTDRTGDEAAVATFDQAGVYQGDFVTVIGQSAALLGIHVREPQRDVLVGDFVGDLIRRYDFDGTPLPAFSAESPQQIAPAAGGRLLTTKSAGSAPLGVFEYDGYTGFELGHYDVINARGVHELPGGTLLVSAFDGVYEIARSNTLLRRVSFESGYYINRFPATGGRALDVCAEDVLLVPSWSLPGLAAFDAQTGDLLDGAFVDDPARLALPNEAIPNFDGDGVLVADFLRSAVFEYDCRGRYVGLFAPAGGVDQNVLFAPRSLTLDPTGTRLWATSEGFGGGAAVAAFDESGVYQGDFVAVDGLPADAHVRDGAQDVLVADAIGNRVRRYDYSGDALPDFVASVGLPLQLAPTAGENVLVASNGASSGVYEYDGAGAQVGF